MKAGVKCHLTLWLSSLLAIKAAKKIFSTQVKNRVSQAICSYTHFVDPNENFTML
jgi:hypothetical protein